MAESSPPAPGRDDLGGERPEQVGAVVALKSLARAKSRLVGLPDPLRRQLAWAMAADTLAALAAAVDLLVVISDEPSLQARLACERIEATVVPEPAGGGMNPALRHGDLWLREHGADVVLACVADLPALRPSTVTTILTAAANHARCFLADATGAGTTIVVARGIGLDPQFQGGSAAAHRSSGAEPLTDDELGGADDARQDVDTVADLRAAGVLGLGVRTSRLVGPTTGALADHCVITVAADHTVITDQGVRLPFDPAVLSRPWLQVRPGQRLHAAIADGQIRSAWL